MDDLKAIAERVIQALKENTAPAEPDVIQLCDAIDPIIWEALHAELRLYRACLRENHIPEGGWNKMAPWVELGLKAVITITELVQHPEIDAVVVISVAEPLGS